MPLPCILEMPGYNLGWVFGYLSDFKNLLSTTRQKPWQNLDQSRTATFQIPSDYMTRRNNGRYICWVTDSVIR
jgi:hypothetical protein